MKRTTLLLLAICFTSIMQAAVTKTITGLTAGGLKAALTSQELATVTDLTISGTIDARDFKTLRDDIKLLEVLDLTGTNVINYYGSEGTNGTNLRTYYANEIPDFAFYDPSTYQGKVTLKSFLYPGQITRIGISAFRGCSHLSGELIIPITVKIVADYAFLSCVSLIGNINLPNSLTTIGNCTFDNCVGLDGDITIPESTVSIGGSAFRSCKGAFYVSPLNSKYTSLEGVLMNKDLTTLIQCSQYKTGSFTIPETVTKIEAYAFHNCAKLTGTLIIPQSVSTIGNAAFYGCSGLTGDLTLPKALTSLGSIAFARCSGLNGKLTLPPSLTIINENAFAACESLTGSITIPESVTKIYNNAFDGCSGLTGEIVIPSSVTTIGANAFKNCSGVFNVNSTNLKYCSKDGVLFNKDKSVLLQCSKSKTGSYTIPNSVLTIDDYAFSGCDRITGMITIPRNVNIIGSNAFENCINLSSFYYPSNAPTTTVGSGLFNNINFSSCILYVPIGAKNNYTRLFQWQSFTNIVEIEEPIKTVNCVAGELKNSFTNDELNSVTKLVINGTIDARDFKTIRDDIPELISLDLSNASISEYTGNEGTKGNRLTIYPANTVPSNAFYNSQLKKPSDKIKKLVYPLTVKAIGDSAFFKMSMDQIETLIPNTIEMIGISAFSNSYVQRELNIPPSVKAIGAWAFSNSYISGNLIIPNSVSSIGEGAFNNCNKLSGNLSISTTISTIEPYTFAKCSNIIGALTIPTSVKTIGKNGFDRCSKLSGDLTIPNTVTSIGDSAFYGCDGFKGSLKLSNSMKRVEFRVFSNCSGLKGDLSIPESVTSIGSWAFAGCLSLNGNLIIPESVNTIGEYAFYKCESLTGDIRIPSSMNIIPMGCFHSCESFNGKVIIPNTITSIGHYAFAYCTNLSGELIIPESVKVIGAGAFYFCAGFKGKLMLPNSLVGINHSAFYYCSGFNGELKIPSSLQSIGENTFYGCRGFTGDLTIPESVTEIGDNAFTGCSGINGTLTIPESVTTLGDYVFQSCTRISKIRVLNPNPLNLKNSTEVFDYLLHSTFLYVPQGSKPQYKAAYQWKLFENIVEIREPQIKTIKCTPGELKNLLTADELINTTDLTITGSIDARDFKTMRDHMDVLSVLDLSNVTIVEYSGSEGTNGSTISIYPSNTIPSNAFYEPLKQLGKSTLTSIQYPKSTVSIGDYSFKYCKGMTGDLIIPNSVTTIGKYAFYGCTGFRGSLTIPNSIISIDDFAFSSNINLSGELIIPNSVKSIGKYAFYGCRSLTGTLTIPESLTTISANCFYSCIGFTGDLTIPKTVSIIEAGAFSGCSGFDGALVIPESVTAINSGAFSDCKGLQGNLIIPNSVKTIGNGAFSNCSGFNGRLSIPNTLTIISPYAFNQCSGLKEDILIPSSVTGIGQHAFDGCSEFEGDLTIPESVISIGTAAFKNCSNLTSIHSYSKTPINITTSTTVFEGVDKYLVFYVPIGSKSLYSSANQWWDFKYYVEMTPTLEKTLTIVAGKLYESLTTKELNTITKLKISGTINARDFKTMRDKMPVLSEIDLSGTTIVAYNGFEGTAYSTPSSSYPDNTIPTNAFYGKLTLKSFVYPKGITKIDNSAFSACKRLEGDLIIPSSVLIIGQYSFSNCVGFSNTLTIPESVTKIYDGAFSGCIRLRGPLKLPESLIYLGASSFSNCKNFTGELIIPEKLTILEDNIFSGCIGLTGQIKIPKTATRISGFTSCTGFTGIVEIPDLVTELGKFAFKDCKGIETIIIPKSVQTINSYCFENLSNIKSIYALNPTPINLTNYVDVFKGIDKAATTLYVPKGSKYAYKFAIFWNDFLNIVEIDGSVSKTVMISAGELNKILTSLELNSIRQMTILGTIDARDFKTMRDEMPNLEELDLKDAVILAYEGADGTYNPISIENLAPSNSLSIGQLKVATTISYLANTIPDYAFYDPQTSTRKLSLKKIELPQTLIGIGEYAFYKCGSIAGTILIPASVESIGNWAFGFCDGLTGNLNIPDLVKTIGNNTFYNCSGFTTLTISETVTTIKEEAFSGCTNLNSIIVKSKTPIDLSFSSNVFFNVNKNATTLFVPSHSLSDYRIADQWKEFLNIVQLEATNISSNIQDLSTSIYPNPTSESINIIGFDGLVSLTITDINGNIVLYKEISTGERISLSHLPKGTYIARIRETNDTKEIKVIKQ